MTELCLNIENLTHAYRVGTLTPIKVIYQIYQRIEEYGDNPIWITLLDRAIVLRSLEELEERVRIRGLEALPLYGIPFAVKDNIDVANLPTTAGCPAYTYQASQHATVVEKLLDAGAILIGKTSLDQFATGLVGTRSPWGACRNAFNSEYISGGSSSGSAVAVAKGFVSFALGTDTAGSGRVPAAFNNIVGLKPTKGLLSTFGVVPASRSLDCVSVFALNCEDARRIFEITQGFDSQDSYSRPFPIESSKVLPKKGFRFGVPKLEQLEFFGDREASQLFEQSIRNLESLSGQPVEIDFAPFREVAQSLYSGAWIVERYSGLKEFVASHPDDVLPVIKQILSLAEKFSAADVFETLQNLQALKQRTHKEWEKMDILLLPTTGTIYKIAEVEAEPIQLNSNLGYYTNFVNLLDLCAIALPAGFRKQEFNYGLPFGITLIAPPFKDIDLCEIGTVYEQAFGDKLGRE
ncbi:allophanate hydrolase [Tumidithrix elongata RA019]|uniref:Allophanate hydrolase n=1 Tax=Tumidithrix elongata BACA0141 TaxID=2716417 RepID=A0AAW9Q0M4_9CYAN|nr:allophanate hydrolase [Tumidithrix elongata RA019]